MKEEEFTQSSQSRTQSRAQSRAQSGAGERRVGTSNRVLIELKSVESLLSIHHKQVLTYLKLSGLKLGLLVNFNTALIKDGIRRIVNDL